MKYRNTKTGAVIETASVVSGGNWVEETDVMDEDAPFDGEVIEEEEEEIPEKPARKRGKKAGDA